jgi:hypothetical protein
MRVDDNRVKKAMMEEMTSIEENNTWSLVDLSPSTRHVSW